jgi:hypothetical protein
MTSDEKVWVTLKQGVIVLRLWETIGPEEYHVAILQLSDARYKEFTKDPKQFLIDYDIFYTKELNEIIAQSTLTPKGDRPGGQNWMVMVEHDWSACNSAFASVLLFAPKPGGY